MGRGWQEKLEEGKENAKADFDQTIWGRKRNVDIQHSHTKPYQCVCSCKKRDACGVLFVFFIETQVHNIHQHLPFMEYNFVPQSRMQSCLHHVFFPKKQMNKGHTVIKDIDILKSPTQNN